MYAHCTNTILLSRERLENIINLWYDIFHYYFFNVSHNSINLMNWLSTEMKEWKMFADCIVVREIVLLHLTVAIAY